MAQMTAPRDSRSSSNVPTLTPLPQHPSQRRKHQLQMRNRWQVYVQPLKQQGNEPSYWPFLHLPPHADLRRLRQLSNWQQNVRQQSLGPSRCRPPSHTWSSTFLVTMSQWQSHFNHFSESSTSKDKHHCRVSSFCQAKMWLLPTCFDHHLWGSPSTSQAPKSSVWPSIIQGEPLSCDMLPSNVPTLTVSTSASWTRSRASKSSEKSKNPGTVPTRLIWHYFLQHFHWGHKHRQLLQHCQQVKVQLGTAVDVWAMPRHPPFLNIFSFDMRNTNISLASPSTSQLPMSNAQT